MSYDEHGVSDHHGMICKICYAGNLYVCEGHGVGDIHWLAAKMAEPTTGGYIMADGPIKRSLTQLEIESRAALYDDLSPPGTFAPAVEAPPPIWAPKTWPNLGAIPVPKVNPYGSISTEPERTEREIEAGKKLGRAIGRL